MAAPILSVPGKVFLLGEYAVLTGAPAWVTALGPRFELHPDGDTEFHPESPAGRFIAARNPGARPRVSGRFVDPWEGRGGFGGSTAEFAMVAYRAGIRDALEAWREYRKLSEGRPEVRRPSGVDLLAQWRGGTIEWNFEPDSVADLSNSVRDLPLLIFSATHLPNRKTVTHSHLETLASGTLTFESLLPSLERARRGLSIRDWGEIGRAFSAYADSLAHLNLEAPAVRNERLALSRLPSVLGAKGCGSLQTDAMLVVVDSLTGPAADSVVEFAERECGLRLISRGLQNEPGIREASR